MVRGVAAPKASQIIFDLESLHQRTSTQNKLDPAKRLNIANQPLKPTNNSAANSKREFPEPDVAYITPKAATKLTPKPPTSTNPNSDDAELDPSFFLRPMATKRARSYSQDNERSRKKAKFEGHTDKKANPRFPPAIEPRYPSSSAKKPMFEGSLAQVKVKSNGSEMAPTAPTLNSSSPGRKLFFSDSNDQEPVGLERLPGSDPKEVLRDYQDDHLFESDAYHFEVTSPKPPKVETAVANPDRLSNFKPSTENDAKDDDDGVHPWYKMVATEEAFDRLFSSIEFVDEPFE